MIAYFLKFFLWLFFKKQINFKNRYSKITETTEGLSQLFNIKKSDRWLLTGVMHSLPVFLILLLLFIINNNLMSHGYQEKLALILASTWTFIGPILIWNYERIIIPKFIKNCKKIMANNNDYLSMRKIWNSPLKSYKVCNLLIALWMISTIVSYIYSTNFINGFEIKIGFNFFYIAISFGVILYSYYTALGFCLSYKAWMLIQIIIKSKLKNNIYHCDNKLGLGFIGDFSFVTFLMLFSGWLFIPLILLMLINEFGQNYYAFLFLLTLYFASILVIFLMPIYIIHRKILNEKNTIAFGFSFIANKLVYELSETWDEIANKRFVHVKSVLLEISSINNWPLRIDVAIKFLLTAVIIPSIAAFVASLLKK